MSDNDNFGGTQLVGENGEQMDPAIAGIAPPGGASMKGDAADAAIGSDLEDEDEDAGDAEIKALDEEDGEADVTASGAE
jgi:hypothetical protein